MNLKPHTPTTEPSVGIDMMKQAYQRPELRTYGAVHQFTQGTKNNGLDGTLGQTKN